MKIAGQRIEPFLSAADPAVCCVLLFGPDVGLVRARADILAVGVVPDLTDPFLVTVLTAAQLKGDATRLVDEAMALSLTGGERVIRVRDASDVLTPVFKDLLGEGRKHSLVVVEAGDLPTRSSLRKLFEQTDAGAVIGCYPDEGRGLEDVIRETLGGYGLSPAADALSFLTSRFGGDRMVIRRELEKLALYVGGSSGATGVVKLADVVDCVGDSAKLSLEAIAYAAADGDQVGLDRELERAVLEGISPVAVLREVQRHLQRLHLAAAQVAVGKSSDQAVSGLRPPVIFKFKDQFQRQIRGWSRRRLNGALEILSEAEIECKTSGTPDIPVCGRTLMRVAQLARAR